MIISLIYYILRALEQHSSNRTDVLKHSFCFGQGGFYLLLFLCKKPFKYKLFEAFYGNAFYSSLKNGSASVSKSPQREERGVQVTILLDILFHIFHSFVLLLFNQIFGTLYCTKVIFQLCIPACIFSKQRICMIKATFLR